MLKTARERVEKLFKGKPKHPAGPPMTLGNMREPPGINRKRDVTSPYKRDGGCRYRHPPRFWPGPNLSAEDG